MVYIYIYTCFCSSFSFHFQIFFVLQTPTHHSEEEELNPTGGFDRQQRTLQLGQILGHCLGETTSNRGRVSCFFVCMNSGNLFFARVLSFIEEDLEIETRTNNKPSEMVSEQLLQKNSWNTETSFALFFLWADVFPITGTGWELSSWPQNVPRLYEADPTWQ